ncbi:MAG: dTMP kinase [Rhizobiales bacterium]|nr:dTMP kinase [Hyphomicrobiales bacterium]
MAGRGLFITFEGGEGSGKSTHVRILDDRLKVNGYEVEVTREPGGTPGAEELRKLLVTGDPQRWSAQAEALLNFAARDDHLINMIRPALAEGKTVICDRFIDSTRAYQGYAGGCDLTLLDALEASIVGDTRPDLTLILDVDPKEGLRRADERPDTGEDRYERKGLEFHVQLREAFHMIAHRNRDRCVIVDTSAPRDKVAETIWRTVAARL